MINETALQELPASVAMALAKLARQSGDQQLQAWAIVLELHAKLMIAIECMSPQNEADYVVELSEVSA